jgi:hypothetical protein
MWRLAKLSWVGKSSGNLTKGRARVVSVAELVHRRVVMWDEHAVAMRVRVSGAAERDASTEAPRVRPRRPIWREAAIVKKTVRMWPRCKQASPRGIRTVNRQSLGKPQDKDSEATPSGLARIESRPPCRYSPPFQTPLTPLRMSGPKLEQKRRKRRARCDDAKTRNSRRNGRQKSRTRPLKTCQLTPDLAFLVRGKGRRSR